MPIDRAITDQLVGDMTTVFKKLKTMRQQLPRQHAEIEQSAYPILFCLDDGARRVSAVAEAVHSDVSTVSRQVCTLEGSGLVAKTPDPSDGRAHVVGLTADGRAFTEQVRSAYSNWFSQILADWSDDDARALSTHLQHLHQSLDAAHDRNRTLSKEVK